MQDRHKIRRVGIYSGAFDPIHSGHIAFAMQSIQAANLDMVYFLPERRPRHKQGVEHFGHRVAMIKQASLPHPKFNLLELTDISFTVEHTLPKLNLEFPDDELVFLFGSDVLPGLGHWSKAERLIKNYELVLGLREKTDEKQIKKYIEEMPVQPKSVVLFPSFAPQVSSGKIREALRRRSKTQGLLTSVQRYSDKHWLYISLANSS
jgi:nicotinate-nucleotide adenylyltransferase